MQRNYFISLNQYAYQKFCQIIEKTMSEKITKQQRAKYILKSICARRRP